MAAFQSFSGRVHRLEMFRMARYKSFIAAWSLGNAPLFLVTFLSDAFIDSMAFVV